MHPLAHVVTGGEPGGGIPAVRDHIQHVTGAFVNEVMGIGDVAPSLFGECPARDWACTSAVAVTCGWRWSTPIRASR